MTLDDLKKLNIPVTSGSYQFYDQDGKLLYVGKAANLKNRVFSYWSKGATHTPAKYSMLKKIEKIKWIETESEIEALLLESNLIKKHQPPYNVAMRDDKRYLYIKISTEDEIPGIFVTRKIDKSGKYFGPFVSALAVRETLKAIRKLWPYCNMRKTQKKACLYYQINLCLGVCKGLISKKEYMDRVIKPIILFLEGKKRKIIKNYEARIKNLESRIGNQELWLEKNKKDNSKFPPKTDQSQADMIYDSKKLENMQSELTRLKFQLSNIHRVLEHAKILGLGEKYVNDTVELAKLLGLKRVPERIEGYDIANIFGREAVGSMVVFRNGEPDKNEYRKFKIKMGQGKANDVGMLKEILERRFKHTSSPTLLRPSPTPLLIRRGIKGEAEERWPLPDLIIIDGGKGQLNAALSVFKKTKLDIPVLAVSKGSAREIPWLRPREAKPISRARGLRSAIAPDKLFFPGEKKPLELPLASPALHLVKRVRDEAHRFAITYHRKLRSKNRLLN